MADYRRDISVLSLLSGYTAILSDDIMAGEGRRSIKVLEPVAAHLTTCTCLPHSSQDRAQCCSRVVVALRSTTPLMSSSNNARMIT